MNQHELSIVDGTAYFCLTHVQPYFKVPKFFNVVKTADFQLDFEGKSFSVKEYLNQRGMQIPGNSYLADYAWLLIEELVLSRKENIDRVVTTLHRKIISREAKGSQPRNTLIANYDGLCLLAGNAVTESDLIYDEASEHLFSKPINFGLHGLNIFEQYSIAHSKTDFVNFLNNAVRANIVTREDAIRFSSSNLFIPAAPIGTCKISTFLNVVSAITGFIKYTDTIKYTIERPEDPYQARARSFFLERLSSFKIYESIGIDLINKISINRKNNQLISNFGYCLTLQNEDDLTTQYKLGNI